MYDRSTDWVVFESRLPEPLMDAAYATLVAVRTVVDSTLCFFGGHEVIDDGCGRPEHRFCLLCRAPFPNGMVRGRLTNR